MQPTRDAWASLLCIICVVCRGLCAVGRFSIDQVDQGCRMGRFDAECVRHCSNRVSILGAGQIPTMAASTQRPQFLGADERQSLNNDCGFFVWAHTHQSLN